MLRSPAGVAGPALMSPRGRGATGPISASFTTTIAGAVLPVPESAKSGYAAGVGVGRRRRASLSSAHTTLPLPSYVRLTTLSNNKSVSLRVRDRGPYHSGRVIAVSVKAATVLGFDGSGLAPVRVEYVGSAPLEGSDDRML